MCIRHSLAAAISLFIVVVIANVYQKKNVIYEKYSNANSKTIEVLGMDVHYRVEGKGETLVLLHGTGSSLHTWDAMANELVKNFRIVRMDLPGSGLTGPNPNNEYEVYDDVNFVLNFLDELSIDNAHFVGNSLGGRIAWQFALDYPERTASITLIDSLGYPQVRWPPAIDMGMNPLVGSIMAKYVPRFVFEASMSDIYDKSFDVSEQLIDRYYELSLRDGNLKAFNDRVKARLDKDSHLIKNISVPTLILWGENDIYFPVGNAYRFNADIAGSKLFVFRDSGHFPMEEHPAEVANEINKFIDSLENMNTSSR